MHHAFIRLAQMHRIFAESYFVRDDGASACARL
jgi:hypothetical protein